MSEIQLLPVGSTVDLWVNGRLLLLHDSPRCCGDEELFVDAVSKAVGDTACAGERLSAGEYLACMWGFA